MTDWACHLFVFVCGEGDHWHKANCEERPPRNTLSRPIPTVMTLRSDAFVAFELGGKLVSAEGDAESHGERGGFVWKKEKSVC